MRYCNYRDETEDGVCANSCNGHDGVMIYAYGAVSGVSAIQSTKCIPHLSSISTNLTVSSILEVQII